MLSLLINQLVNPSPPRRRRTSDVTRQTGWIHAGSLSSRILGLLEDHNRWSVASVSEALNADPVAVKSAFYRLETKKLVVRDGTTSKAYRGGPVRPMFRRAKGGRG